VKVRPTFITVGAQVVATLRLPLARCTAQDAGFCIASPRDCQWTRSVEETTGRFKEEIDVE
jgi:hypothetical protein